MQSAARNRPLAALHPATVEREREREREREQTGRGGDQPRLSWAGRTSHEGVPGDHHQATPHFGADAGHKGFLVPSVKLPPMLQLELVCIPIRYCSVRMHNGAAISWSTCAATRHSRHTYTHLFHIRRGPLTTPTSPNLVQAVAVLSPPSLTADAPLSLIHTSLFLPLSVFG